MTIPKEGDWIKVPKAKELVGEDWLDGDTPILVAQSNQEGQVWAGGVQWEVGEYELCTSPLFRVGKKQERVILNSEGLEVAHFLPQYKHLIPQVLEALNSQYL